MSSVMWDGPELAERYDRISDMQFKSGSILVDRMGIKKGDAVLDVGCGTGRLALYVSKIVGPQGRVTGIDPSPHRIRIAESKLKGRDFHNVRFLIGEAEDLHAFTDNTFDDVYYSSVFHWLGDKRTALQEAYRVLKHGGNVGMTTVDRDYHFAMKEVMEKLFTEKYPGISIDNDFSKMLVNRKELEELLTGAGFGDVNIFTLEEKHYYSSPEEFFGFIEASSFGNFLRQVPDRIRPKVLEDMGKELENMRTGKGIELTSNTMYAIARKPR